MTDLLYYTLDDDGDAVAASSPDGSNYRRLAFRWIGNLRVSTVFLGVGRLPAEDEAWGGPGAVFETMLMDEHGDDIQRYRAGDEDHARQNQRALEVVAETILMQGKEAK